MPSENQINLRLESATLNDKWDLEKGRILINSTQAIARALIEQARLDHSQGRNTAGFVTGYRGSPLGSLDSTLWSVADRLATHDIRFIPGVNEDLAATAVRGTQQLGATPGATRDGVFAAWYGKGPGVDRSIDALKHGNYAGAHENGGVLIYYGDDHAGKSSTVSHQSEQALASALIPSLYPANVGELISYSLLGFALSRYSGTWVGVKCVNEVAEQTASVDIDFAEFCPTQPPLGELPPEGIHCRHGVYGPLRDEQIVTDYRLPLVSCFIRANHVDREVFRSSQPRLGLVAAGKSYGDTLAALTMLGLDKDRAKTLGISLYKVGCIWPLEPEGLTKFALDHHTLFVIEEKKSFIELQSAGILINESTRPQIVGKRDEQGRRLLPEVVQLDPVVIALAILDRLDALGIGDNALIQAGNALRKRLETTAPGKPDVARKPYFCSGCPHNRSTRIPEGSISMTGIGCHTMVNFMRPSEALPPTHMGGEGANWIGLAPYTKTPHVFQNMGDGTYYHSGLLAIRAAVASGINITYKILYNDAVAMTGGQPVDGPISVAEIAQQVRHEGVRMIVVVSDNPNHHRANSEFPYGTQIEHRDHVDDVQRKLREVSGCSVLIFEQTCAVEKRRRRKRSEYPDPPRRLFISTSVCEGCGDCSAQSTCVSLVPVDTALGVKRQIDQSSCNKDYSCLNGFCPSFITIDNADLRTGAIPQLDQRLFADLPPAARAIVRGPGYNIMVAGIGGTGVVTVSAIIGMAAHIDGRAASLFDMTGLAQKNGAVYSHIRIADSPATLHTQKLGIGETDLLLAFDMVAALGDESAATLEFERSRIVANGDVAPTAAFQFDREALAGGNILADALRCRVGEGSVFISEATSLALMLLGNGIGANLFLVGVAAQLGLLPIGVSAVEQAVRLNGVSVHFNLTAFALGRLFVVDRSAVESLLPANSVAPSEHLDDVIERSAEHLERYQSARYAARYREQVAVVRRVEQQLGRDSTDLTHTVARNYAKLLSYKDEYEVARLLVDPALYRELAERFAGNPRISFNLAPPVISKKGAGARPKKMRIPAHVAIPLFRVLAALKKLRGTPLDPFGYTMERRTERQLITEYEKTIAQVAESLSPANYDRAVHLLSLPDGIRGFGPVKQDAVERYRVARTQALREFST